MNILLLGSGGRESALAWKIAQSKKNGRLYIAPGNAGTKAFGENIDMKETDFYGIKNLVREKGIDMIVVGPEVPLVRGIYDFVKNDEEINHVAVIGPSASGARLEGSKDFAKDFMKRHRIPTAKHLTVSKSNFQEGIVFFQTIEPPYVLKADGLAAGKGVVIVNELKEAEETLGNMLNGSFGEAGRKVVLEEFLTGIECSVFIMTDGKSYKILPEAKDYKRIGEGDKGLNTGGMGSVSPVPFADRSFMDKVEKEIIVPTIDGIKEEKLDYKGFIFFGLINVKGDPYLIEYNCRMGDPETESVLLRIKSDFVDLLEGITCEDLDARSMETDPRTAVSVMLVSGGYPGEYKKGEEISGLDDVRDSIVFQAGTIEEGGKILTNGGRVLAISSYGKDKKEALAHSYKNAEAIRFKNKYYRKDIGFDL